MPNSNDDPDNTPFRPYSDARGDSMSNRPAKYDSAARTPMPTLSGASNGDVGGGNGYGHWAWSETGNKWLWIDTAQVPTNLPQGGDAWRAATYDPTTDTGGGINAQFNKQYQDAHPDPFGNEMPDMTKSYTPFGLQSSFGGMGAGGGPGGSQFSYLSDQLVPSLEQRRMGMINQMVTPQGGK